MSVKLLGINHQSPLIHLPTSPKHGPPAGNQSPIPFDTLVLKVQAVPGGWESITNPL